LSFTSFAPQFGAYLLSRQRPAWREQYLDYRGLKQLIKRAAAAEAINEVCGLEVGWLLAGLVGH